MLRPFAGTIGRIYYWFKEGRKENFWKRVFLRTEYTIEEMNREYYKGLEIVIGTSLVLFSIYLLYKWLTNDLP